MHAKRFSARADIDIFRGIAALLVVSLHTREITWIGLNEFWKLHGTHVDFATILGYISFPLVWGSIGVPVFFVLSGYCIHFSQATERHRDAAAKFTVGNFYLRRFFRIYPVLFGALLFTFACDWWSGQILPKSVKLGDTGVTSFLVNLFSLQGIVGNSYGSNGVLWTLSIEVQFYALYPLLLLAMTGWGELRTLIGLAILNIGSYLVLQRNGYVLFSSYYVSWYLGALVAEADAGGVLKGLFASRILHMCGFGLSFALCCAGFAVFFLGPVSQYAAFHLWAVGFAGFLVIYLTRSAALQGPLARLFRWFGSFSYSIYIVHVPFVILLGSILFHSQKQASPYPFYLITVAAVACAYGFSVVFEKPALALSKAVRKHAEGQAAIVIGS
jgi:peptidoglycan/LPS O-acetylase OafA/YrhL